MLKEIGNTYIQHAHSTHTKLENKLPENAQKDLRKKSGNTVATEQESSDSESPQPGWGNM